MMRATCKGMGLSQVRGLQQSSQVPTSHISGGLARLPPQGHTSTRSPHQLNILLHAKRLDQVLQPACHGLAAMPASPELLS